jgi:hypothetical protein
MMFVADFGLMLSNLQALHAGNADALQKVGELEQSLKVEKQKLLSHRYQ